MPNSLTTKTSDFEIKELDEIIAIEMLVSNYEFDPIKYSRKELAYMVELLQMALRSNKIK